MFPPSGVVQGDLWGRRTSSPSGKAYDGLPVRRARRTTDFQSVGQGVRRTSSPSGKAYRWINGRDGLEVRRTRRSKRKFAATPQTTAFLRVQTSDSTKDSIEIKLPEAGQRLEARGNSQTTGELWCDHQQVSNDHEACSWTRKSSVITQHATEVLRLQLPPRSEQERRDKADTAVLQTARRRVRAELRKGK
jgi:hypothetical protein